LAAPDTVRELIERFSRNFEAYRSPNYNEAQVRSEFIDPFFCALGWDMYNKKGYAEAYKQVVHEASLKVGGSTKAPDYSFRIGCMRKFFLEAKKPAVNLKDDISPAYQLRRYAWSAKLPLSILTDFEEFAVYDCRIRPSINDKPARGRILYLQYGDYLEQWDELASIFSPDAIMRGSFDKYAESTARKRGTTEVDDSFLDEIETWREMLARNIALRNRDLSQRDLNFAVQRTIDRIIFLRICEDRGVEGYGLLQRLLKNDEVYPRLYKMFELADQRYNSGLFHFHKEKGRAEPDTLTPHLIIDDKPLKEIIKRLYYPESPFEFSVLPADILGHVYEQFLGKVIRLTRGHQAKIEEKPEVRKAGGVYYTPTYIVDYIVKNTVGKLLEGKKPGPNGSASKLRILDPACGSGSFLLGAYQYLLDWHLEQYTNGDTKKWSRGKSPTIFRDSLGVWRLTSDERKRILLNNIYGVDIDSQAVEVTKLSLLLKVLEDVTAEALKSQYEFMHERALPDLSSNIKCGNSLIGPDFYDSRQMDLLDDEEKYRINVFDWNAEFADIMSKGGFDAVIGNPPYVRQESLGELKSYFKNHYETFHGMADLYTYFIERALKLLSKGGRFGYIVSNKWMKASYGKPLRNWLKNFGIEQVIDFGDLPVFRSAAAYPSILIITKIINSNDFLAANIRELSFTYLDEYIDKSSFKMDRLSLENDSWMLISESVKRLINRLSRKCIKFEKYVQGKIFRGIVTGYNKAFVIDTTKREELIKSDKKNEDLIRPFLIGRDIKRYEPLETERYIIFTRRGINIKDYPEIENHLLQYRNWLMPKPKDWKGKKWIGRKEGNYKWYEIQDTIAYYLEFAKPKIIYPNICNRPEFSYDEKGIMTNQKCFIISIPDKYLLGILNSKIMYFLFKMILPRLRGGFYEPSYIYMKDLPIYKPDLKISKERSLRDQIIKMVDIILSLNKKLTKAKTEHDRTVLQRQIEATDRKIDQLVYELYGLTDKEIAIVEEAAKR
jgi:hypothetical protein